MGYPIACERLQGAIGCLPINESTTSKFIRKDADLSPDRLSRYIHDMACVATEKLPRSGSRGFPPILITRKHMPGDICKENGGCSQADHCLLLAILWSDDNRKFLLEKHRSLAVVK